MIRKGDLLDPNALERLSRYERSVVEGAQNAGYGPRHMNTEKFGSGPHAGALHQVVNPAAIRAAEMGEPGGDSDISDGVGNLSETAYYRNLK